MWNSWKVTLTVAPLAYLADLPVGAVVVKATGALVACVARGTLASVGLDQVQARAVGALVPAGDADLFRRSRRVVRRTSH